jgi:hypothetical protein
LRGKKALEAAAVAGMAARRSSRLCIVAMLSKPRAVLRSARMPHLMHTCEGEQDERTNKHKRGRGGVSVGDRQGWGGVGLRFRRDTYAERDGEREKERAQEKERERKRERGGIQHQGKKEREKGEEGGHAEGDDEVQEQEGKSAG